MEKLTCVMQVLLMFCIFTYNTLAVDAQPIINFFNVLTNNKYDAFVPLYASFALHFVESSVCEFAVSNKTEFEERHADSLRILQKVFGDRVTIRESDIPARLQNKARFVDIPTIWAKRARLSRPEPDHGDAAERARRSVADCGRPANGRPKRPFI